MDRVFYCKFSVSRGDYTLVAFLTAHCAIERSCIYNNCTLVAICQCFHHFILCGQRADSGNRFQFVVTNKGRGDCRIKRLINSRICAHIVGCLPCFSRHLTLLLHRCIKAVLVNGEPFFLKDFFCQVDREAVGIVQAERILAIHYSLSFCRHLFFQIRQNCKSLIDRLIEFVFFLRQDI